MKRNVLILILLFFSISNVEAKKIQGYFISNTHDTVNVLLNIPIKFFAQTPNFESIQKKIKYYDSSNIKQILKPEMAIEVAFELEGVKYRMLSMDDELGLTDGLFSSSEKLFLHIIKDGKLKLFEYHFSSGAGGGMTMGAGGGMTMTGGGNSSSSKYILKKGNEHLYEVDTDWLFASFSKDMSNYFSDCPELVRKIQEKVYGRDDIELMVDEYNRIKI